MTCRVAATLPKAMKDMQKILSHVRSAVDKYRMIEPGDRIAVGISGGKDSLTMLCALAQMRHFYPVPYEIVAIQIDMGFHLLDGRDGVENTHDGIRRLCEEIDVPYVLEKTEIAKIIFDAREESNPCSLCAKMRRGALHKAAVAAGCNKLALGHHFDDAAETMMLNLFFEGRIGCFSPVTHLSRREIDVIRPMIHTEEKMIKSFAYKNALPVEESTCPADGNTQRAAMREYLKSFDKEHHYGLYRRLVGSLERAGIDGWKASEKEPHTANDEETDT